MGKRKDSPLSFLSPNQVGGARKVLQTTPVPNLSTGKENDRKHSLSRSRVSRLKQSNVSAHYHLGDEVTEILGNADGCREVASGTEILHDAGAYREVLSAERPLPVQGTEILRDVDGCREVVPPESPSSAAASVKKEFSGSSKVNHRRPALEVAIVSDCWRNGAPNGNDVHPSALKPEESLHILQEAYNKLYEKYQRLKTTKDLEEIEAVFDEQRRRFAEFSKAADNLVHKLQRENNLLERQLKETNVDRLKQMENELIESRNDVVMEQSKVLALEQQLRQAQQHISELESRAAANVETPGDRVLCCAHGEQTAETSAAGALGGEFLHKLLQRLTQMSVVADVDSSRLVFTHEETGFSFTLEQNERSRLLGEGDNAVIFKVISHGSTVHVAADTLPSELVFDIVQAEVFFHMMLMPHISKFMYNL
ncbi:hypothetical protein R1sor_020024 [Riccia sorocarpa]|uniref:DUF7806 domain-containing protein n=1 Tax=Riccia sorocarpa TaxID=122646 RepID=A0ABD3IEC5_9MARC